MSKFKVGDRVKFIEDSRGQDYTYGNYGLKKDEVYKLDYTRSWVIVTTTGNDVYFAESSLEYNLELVEEIKPITINSFICGVAENYKNNKTKMTLINTFKKLTRSEPEKTFVKAGVLNEELTLTEDGKELFLNYMFEKNKVEFKKEVVDAIIAEQEKK